MALHFVPGDVIKTVTDPQIYRYRIKEQDSLEPKLLGSGNHIRE